MKPSSKVFLWENKNFDVLINGDSLIDNQLVSPDLKPVPVGKASVEPQPMTLIWKSESAKKSNPRLISNPKEKRADEIFCTEPVKLSATCAFTVAGRFEALASHSIVINQPDGVKETHFSNESSSLLGAIKAVTEYRFAFEPIPAIAGMTREFTIDAVKIEITGIQPFLVKQFPSTFLEPMEMVKPLLTNRPPIKLTGFDHFGYFGPVVKKEKLGSGKTLDVYFQENFPEGKYLKIWWVPTLYLDNDQELPLAEVVRKIKPDKFSDLIRSRLHFESHELVIGEETQAQFFFGPSSDVADQQGTIFLYDKDYQVTLEGVTWKSNDEILSQNKPNILFSRQSSGKYLLSASGTFSVVPKEGEEFKATYIQAGEPVWPIKVLGKLGIRNKTDNSELNSYKLSYRANTQFEAFTKYENGESEPVLVDWKLDGDFIPMGTKRGDILNYFGIQVKNYQIGCLSGSSTAHLGATQTLFTSLLSGKVKLVAQHGKMAVSTTLLLSQPTVYCHFKTIGGLDNGNLDGMVDTWVKEANRLWGQGNESLLLIKPENKEVISVPNEFFDSLEDQIPATMSSELFLKKSPFNETSINLSNPLFWDDIANRHYEVPDAFHSVVPRQAETLLKKERVNSAINVYIVRQPYANILDVIKTQFGGTVTKDDYFRRNKELQRIDDKTESGIIIQWKEVPKLLAHELGHALIQNGDEHKGMTEEFLMNINLTGEKIRIDQWIKALDYENAKTFIREE